MCPLCKQVADRVIYYGLPMFICRDCQALFGFWSHWILWLPFYGQMMVYTGSYWPALWHWLRGVDDE